jgi:hypothetical protein
MPSVETSIFQAIKARVDTLPMKATYPIVWATDESYSPSPSQPFLRVTWLPNRNQRLLIGSNDAHRRPAILQIDVMGQKTSGEDVAREIAGQVAAHFPADLEMHFQGVKVRVTKAPDVGPSFVDKHIQIPVSVEVEALI